MAVAADPTTDHADQGRHRGAEHGAADAHSHAQQSPGDRRQDQTRGHRGHGAPVTPGEQGRHTGQAHAPGQQADHRTDHGSAASAADDDPAGNNGTVKIAGLGELDGIPNNTPHPGCTFQVEWYGFDGGPDVVSTVTFEMQAPTADATVTVDGPSQVMVGEDAASGAGTSTGLDAVQAYTLSFEGEPHAQQGYHVRLTVATPRSQGNDTKTKVFWVEPCADTGAGRGSELGSGAAGLGGRGEGSGVDQGVLGETYAAGAGTVSADAAAVATAGNEAAVPTAVDAGEDAMLPTWAQSPLPLTLASFVLVLAGVAIVLRNRARA
ncbi:MAG TPA: hypothetical protein VGD85_13730 [Nocardioides sp.]